MNVRKLVALFLVLLPGIFLSSCGGDEDKPDDPAPASVAMKCLPVEQYRDTTRWYKYYYDANNRPVKTDWKDNNKFYTTTHVYNSNNQLVELTQVQTNGSGYFYATYTNNASGRRQKMESFIKQNNVLVPQRTISYTYSSTGQLQRKDEDIHYPTSSTGYTTYNFTNNTVTANSYTSAGTLYWIEEYEFDNNKTSGSDITPPFRNEFDISHNIIRYTLKFPSGGSDFQRSYTASFSFNSDGYPIQRVERDPNGDVRWTETYTYNCQ